MAQGQRETVTRRLWVPFLLGVILFIKIKIKLNQLHAVSRTQQGRQRVPSVKTLRSPLSAFRRVLDALRVEWRNSTPRFASTPERRNDNLNVNKYLSSSFEDRTHNQSILQSHSVPRRHDWPHLFIIKSTLKNLLTELLICS